MAENYKHLYEQMKKLVEKYQDEIVPGLRKVIEDQERKWIPVTDDLPEPFKIVCVYDSTEKMVSNAYITRHQEWVGVCMNHEVTHWMPMPEPPKEGQ